MQLAERFVDAPFVIETIEKFLGAAFTLVNYKHYSGLEEKLRFFGAKLIEAGHFELSHLLDTRLTPPKAEPVRSPPRKGRTLQSIHKVYLQRKEKEENSRSLSEQATLKEIKEKRVLRKQIEQRRVSLGVKSRLRAEGPLVLHQTAALPFQLVNFAEEAPDEQELFRLVRLNHKKLRRALFHKFANSGYRPDVKQVGRFEAASKGQQQMREGRPSNFCQNELSS